jgi:hypothetical protein
MNLLINEAIPKVAKQIANFAHNNNDQQQEEKKSKKREKNIVSSLSTLVS